jgi:hypothetical protein
MAGASEQELLNEIEQEAGITEEQAQKALTAIFQGYACLLRVKGAIIIPPSGPRDIVIPPSGPRAAAEPQDIIIPPSGPRAVGQPGAQGGPCQECQPQQASELLQFVAEQAGIGVAQAGLALAIVLNAMSAIADGVGVQPVLSYQAD